jgi:hypothetical protein
MTYPLKELDLVGEIDTVEVTIKVFSEDNEYHCYIYEPTSLPQEKNATAASRNVEVSPKNEGCIGLMRLQSLPNQRTRISFSRISSEDRSEDSEDRFREYCSKLLNYFVMGGFIQVFIDRTGAIGFKLPDNRVR